jgi:hypothetical protein
MIKKLTNFFCILPLLAALGAAQVTADDQFQPPTTDAQEKENIEDCIKKIREQQNKIRGEVEKIKKIIRDRKNSQDKDRA